MRLRCCKHISTASLSSAWLDVANAWQAVSRRCRISQVWSVEIEPQRLMDGLYVCVFVHVCKRLIWFAVNVNVTTDFCWILSLIWLLIKSGMNSLNGLSYLQLINDAVVTVTVTYLCCVFAAMLQLVTCDRLELLQKERYSNHHAVLLLWLTPEEADLMRGNYILYQGKKSLNVLLCCKQTVPAEHTQ